jgi:glycosyltransferase involved in cell wall biosynthesis
MRFPGRQIETFFTPRALARADVIAVVSQFTRQRLAHYFPQHAHKVRVVPGASLLAGIAGGEPRAAAGRGDYFLFVGTLEPRKNLPRLLRAYRQYVDQVALALPLQIAGGSGWGGENLASLVAGLGLSQHVRLLGRVEDAALPALYGGARALLMPSLYEGFGLPVVEALSAGVPVITSADSAMAEVAGAAGLYVDPRSEEDITRGLVTIATNRELHASLRERSIPEVSRYNWELSSATMADLLLR